MRTSILSRSVVALASLAVGSVALASVPATAATPSGITRETVLAAASGIRAAYTSGDDPTPATAKAVRTIVNRGCGVNGDDGELLVDVDGIPTAAGPSAEGFVAYGQIVNIVDETARQCIVGLVASVAADHVLSGTATMSATVNPGGQVATVSAALSGDVSATTPIVISGSSSFGGTPTFTASGAASKTTKVPAKTVKDVKTKAQKKAAKKKYAKKLASLKKSYAKALKKAGSSKSKKAAAKKAYATKKRAAKAAYRYAVADYKIVKKASTSTEVLPFNIALLTL